MNISYNGFNENTMTFEAEESLKSAGVPVKITENGKVAPCGEGDKICGVAVNVREGYASVQLCGFVELPCEGEIPTGFQTVSAGKDGSVKVSADGREVLVLSGTSETAGFIL